MSRSISQEGLDLIKRFEGLSLEAYPDPGTGGRPYTIGYGRAHGVELGDRITKEEAERMLREDVAHFEHGVEHLLPGLRVSLTNRAFDAIVSFSYNVGLGALTESTLRRRLLNGEDPEVVIAEELPRWNKGGNGVMPGLVRRRAAEVEHARWRPPGAPASPVALDDTTTTPEAPQSRPEVDLVDFFRHFSAYEHQLAAVEMLSEELSMAGLLDPESEWIKEYRRSIATLPTVIKEPPAPLAGSFVQLSVPYLYQLDSDTDQGPRMCFSSTNAMLIEGLEPGTLRGDDQEDDAYLNRVFEYGDTTSADAQVRALRSYGIDAEFRTDGTSQMAKDLLRAGIPVPIGVLIRGSASKPHGGGHWILLVGFDDKNKQWICHDPNGEMDVLNGGYVSWAPSAGRYVRYSYYNLNRRWMVAGEGDGWMVEAVR